MIEKGRNNNLEYCFGIIKWYKIDICIRNSFLKVLKNDLKKPIDLILFVFFSDFCKQRLKKELMTRFMLNSREKWI